MTNTIVSTITIGRRIDAIALDPTANLLYVAETQNPGNVAVVNLASNTITATIPVGNMASPEAQLNIAVVPSIQRAFVTNVNDGTVSVISTASNSVTATVTVGTFPTDLRVGANGKVYVSNFGSGTVSIFDSSTLAPIATVAVGANPRGINIDPATDIVYVSVSTGNNIVTIDPSTNNLVNSIPGNTPYQTAVLNATF
ncbi:YncE family protein [Bacillus cereus]|uniref:YncE family protein n=1 Tax=Bacillus cereus TaxID=1396 RepID=UPI003EE2A237